MKEITRFVEQFQFQPHHAWKIGWERESQLVNPTTNQAVPAIDSVMDWVMHHCNGLSHCFGPEFNVSHFEERLAQPCSSHELEAAIKQIDAMAGEMEQAVGVKRVFWPIAPPDIPTQIVDHPRYLDIANNWLSEAGRDMVRRLSSVHILIGMPDLKTAIRVYDRLIDHYDHLVDIGSFSQGQRVHLFEQHVQRTPQLIPCRNLHGLYQRARTEQFERDLGMWWDMIRISKYGAIEFRMFDTTDDIRLMVNWAKLCLIICREAAKN